MIAKAQQALGVITERTRVPLSVVAALIILAVGIGVSWGRVVSLESRSDRFYEALKTDRSKYDAQHIELMKEIGETKAGIARIEGMLSGMQK